MTLFLRRSDDLADIAPGTPWITTGDAPASLNVASKLPGAARLLDDAFNDVRAIWWKIGCELGAEASGELSHAASCASMNSDFGVMLAWDAIAQDLGGRPGDSLLVCDDPWLFRHLAGVANVVAGAPPAIASANLRLKLRGIAARVYLATKLALSCLRLASQRVGDRASVRGGGFLLVYGHPASKPSGYDAYFGSLMEQFSSLRRILHTDCPADMALHLGTAGNTISFHAYGSIFAALRVVFCRWRPSANARTGRYGWLVRRAAAFEGSGAAAAATRWQTICQSRWLASVRPSIIAWPWECHPWERALVRAARKLGVATVGYQHTVVGRQMFNMTPRSDPAGEAVLPDCILCTGPAYRKQLEDLGVPGRILKIAGSFRITPVDPGRYDAAGPIFIALAANADISAQMMAAVRNASPSSRQFLVKEHPMYPFNFEETPELRRTTSMLHQQQALAAVLYSTGTVGLESMLSGIPTIKFLPEGCVATDIMPDGLRPREADAAALADAITALPPRAEVDPRSIIAPIDLAVWRSHLGIG